MLCGRVRRGNEETMRNAFTWRFPVILPAPHREILSVNLLSGGNVQFRVRSTEKDNDRCSQAASSFVSAV